MSMQITVATASTVRQELPQDAVRQMRAQAENRAAALDRAEALLPGHSDSDSERMAIKAATDDLEHISLAFNKRLKFVVDHESQEVIVKVIDSTTDKVIKVLPPEELQRLHDRIRETIGTLFDRSV